MSLARPVDHRRVPVDDGVQDRVQHRLAALGQQRRLALQPPAHPRQVRRLAVPHGDREVRAEEQVQLAELDLLGRVEVPRGLEDDEQRVAVPLELRPLVGLDRVLDGELGQVVQLGQLTELLRLGPVEPEPGQPVLALRPAPRGSRPRSRASRPGVRRSRRRCRPSRERPAGAAAAPAARAGARPPARGRRVSVVRAVSGARRRSVMTDSRESGDDEGHREVLARRRPAAGGGRGQAGRTSGSVLGGSLRIAVRPLPVVPATVRGPSSIVTRGVQSPEQVNRQPATSPSRRRHLQGHQEAGHHGVAADRGGHLDDLPLVEVRAQGREDRFRHGDRRRRRVGEGEDGGLHRGPRRAHVPASGLRSAAS